MSRALSEILTPDSAFIFRITHRDNLGAILRSGLHCRSSEEVDPRFVEIGNPEIVSRRHSRRVPIAPGGTLSDYVPFYFTPCTPMLYNIVSGWNGMRQRARAEIIVLVSSLDRVEQVGTDFVVADRNASLMNATITAGRKALNSLPWEKWRARDFKRDVNDPSTMERYQAEALVHRHLPIGALAAIIIHDDVTQVSVKQALSESGVQLPVRLRPDWYP